MTPGTCAGSRTPAAPAIPHTLHLLRADTCDTHAERGVRCITPRDVNALPNAALLPLPLMPVHQFFCIPTRLARYSALPVLRCYVPRLRGRGYWLPFLPRCGFQFLLTLRFYANDNWFCRFRCLAPSGSFIRYYPPSTPLLPTTALRFRGLRFHVLDLATG